MRPSATRRGSCRASRACRPGRVRSSARPGSAAGGPRSGRRPPRGAGACPSSTSTPGRRPDASMPTRSSDGPMRSRAAGSRAAARICRFCRPVRWPWNRGSSTMAPTRARAWSDAWEPGIRAGTWCRIGVGQSEQHPDERRLAGTVRAEVAERAAPRDEELHAVDGDVVPEPLGQPVGLHRPRALSCPSACALEDSGRAHLVPPALQVRTADQSSGRAANTLDGCSKGFSPWSFGTGCAEWSAVTPDGPAVEGTCVIVGLITFNLKTQPTGDNTASGHRSMGASPPNRRGAPTHADKLRSSPATFTSSAGGHGGVPTDTVGGRDAGRSPSRPDEAVGQDQKYRGPPACRPRDPEDDLRRAGLVVGRSPRDPYRSCVAVRSSSGRSRDALFG